MLQTSNKCRRHAGQIFRIHSRAYKHDYKEFWQVLDADVTGLPCGGKQGKANKGYFSKEGIRHGRQMGRVIASLYEEVVVDNLYAGNVQLLVSLRSMIRAAEEVLELDEEKRKRTIVRMDAGGGSVDEVNWLLTRDYQIHCKDFSSVRARALAETVTKWVADKKSPTRELGWVQAPSDEYVYPVKRLATRFKKKNKQWSYAVLLSTLEAKDVLQLTGQAVDKVSDEEAVMSAYAAFYDARGGTIEIEIKEDKQGVAISKRSKKKFCGQQMVMMLSSLAHNLIVWVRHWMSGELPKIKEYGLLRIVRDVFQVSGLIEMDEGGRVRKIILNKAAMWGRRCAGVLRQLLKGEHVTVILGET